MITLGCSKNLVDSEVLMGQLQANNINVEHKDEITDSNILVINTCGFIENAKQQSIDTILSGVEAKKNGRIEKLIVTGCLSHRYRDDLSKEIAEVDAWFGTNELPRLLKTLKADYKQELVGERLLTTPTHYAYLKIAEGCDRPCSFCSIPLMRGKHVSVPKEQLIKQAAQLVKNGVKEIILIAQDLTYYGLDLYKKRALASLLEELATVDGLEWIRLHYAYPSGFPEEVLDVMAAHKNICKYLDIPLQHISDKMLTSMRRGITKDKTNALIKTIREKVPGIHIRTTLICGYPGETLKDHQEMLEWIKVQKFERLGVFTYSHEENTHAYQLKDSVSAVEKKKRADAIMKAQMSISANRNKEMIGKTYRVLVDSKDEDQFSARTEFDSPEVDNLVKIDAKKHYVRVGDFVNVKITSAGAYDLVGEPINT